MPSSSRSLVLLASRKFFVPPWLVPLEASFLPAVRAGSFVSSMTCFGGGFALLTLIG
jgi:hypothetical protein